jgi:hypothetical protein
MREHLHNEPSSYADVSIAEQYEMSTQVRTVTALFTGSAENRFLEQEAGAWY